MQMSQRTFRTVKEIELLEGCLNVAELRSRYVKRFGEPKEFNDTIALETRVQSLYNARKTLLAKLPGMRAAEEAKKHAFTVPATIVTKATSNGKPAPFADDALMVKIHNLIAEQVQLQKETLEAINILRDATLDQYQLFQNQFAKVAKRQEPSAPDVSQVSQNGEATT